MSDAETVHLVMVYRDLSLDIEDFEKIARRVRQVAGHIRVFLQRDEMPSPALLDELAVHRTFVFSPIQLGAFHVRRGCVFAGRPMQKSEQLLRLQLAGVPVPMWTSLDRGKRFDPDVWGDYVVLKPEIGSRARGVRIIKTETLNDRTSAIASYRRDGDNFIVQQMIRNESLGKLRIHTLFDRILYSRLYRFSEPAKFETEADIHQYEKLFQTDSNISEYYESEEIFAVARRCGNCFDGVPMLGLDILMDEAGKPWFLEANPGGNTWHFSSTLRGRILREKGVFLETQFDAFNLCGELLALKSNELAV